MKSIVKKKGCKLLDHTNAKVHVSGHPSKEELEKMYNWISPDLLIPIHGEYRHLEEHIEFSRKKGIKNQILVENGDLIKLDKGKEFSGLIPGSKTHIIKDCGHMVILENAFEMREKIIEFLKNE